MTARVPGSLVWAPGYNVCMTAAQAHIQVRGESLAARRFSTSDYLRMIEAGMFGPSDRVELIEGMIVARSPAGPRHHHVLTRLTTLFAPLYDRLLPSVQGTIILADGEVYDPDFMVLCPRPGGYKASLPQGSDVLLLIEASDSSLKRDQHVKLPASAAAGISEYWIADLDREALLVHRDPQGQSYRDIRTLTQHESVAPLAAPDLTIEVREVYA